MTANGALFLESVLRNVDYNSFRNCWGRAFDVTVAIELNRSTFGQSWLSATTQSRLSIDDEVSYWQQYGINHFDTQWQNFKLLGLVNSYAVSNMFGMSYPFTLQYQNASFRFEKETTLKMYWGLACDLTAATHNTSQIPGLSLVRSSPSYAFANTSLASVLRANGTLPSPLGNAFVVMQNILGPFGSVDMYYIPCPLDAKLAVRQSLVLLRRALDGGVAAQSSYSQISHPLNNLSPAPKAWTDIGFAAVGGNLLCEATTFASAFPVSFGMTTLTSWGSACYSLAIWTSWYLTREAMIVSAIMSNLTSPAMIADTCAQNALYTTTCLVYLNQTVESTRPMSS
ncbi:Aste57867_4999 [Aphanomyces stellatus]|uniref:Aste57867_4999 protein n=1 Tax=Aphanomyces stellatus TaxID=120398 RepID=A0A485KGK7_9STRA|nr:hypothetical protein As57867_004986 [Aphanomyces stellatus]VFT82084.1 Aste57867_4999 [Aphanomyces stellatus]